MTVMIAGLLLFLGVHLIPAVPPLRASVASRTTPNRYKGLFSAAAGLGLVLIIAGYWMSGPTDRLFDPVMKARAAAPWVVTIAFVLFAASHMRGHIRRVLQHPMVIGVMLWSGVHLLANGDRRGSVLFGSFLAWAVIDLVASYARGPIAPFEPRAKHDFLAIAGGVLAAGIVMMIHQPLFGVRPI